MTQLAHISHTAASFGYHSNEAKFRLRVGETKTARWHAKHARSDWRALCHATGLPAPKAHRTADSFTA